MVFLPTIGLPGVCVCVCVCVDLAIKSQHQHSPPKHSLDFLSFMQPMRASYIPNPQGYWREQLKS